MDKSINSTRTTGNSLRLVSDDDEEMDSDALTKMMQREWNTVDFAGKYHLSKFANKETSLPGTQVRVERDYQELKAAQAKQWEDEAAARAKRTQEKLRVKSESAQLNTKIYFDTILGQNIKEAEDILNEREAILNHVEVIPDSKRDIERYLKNVKLNRHHYIGFAASNGFRSINYVDPVFGNSALHLSVKMGHVNTTEELLKYNADMDCINRLGSRPIHECWAFWDNNPFRTIETRLQQENLTCQLLLTLLKYGTCVDSVDQNKESVLHIACRRGPTRAVKIILSFQANLLLKNIRGQTAIDIAAAAGNEESLKLLLCWGHISHELVHLDFHAIWHRFLTDYSQVISTHKSAAAILAEIDIASSIRRMKQSNNGAVPIDDPLLQSAYEMSKLCTPVPRPWDGPAWNAFVKEKQAEGTLDIRTQLENLALQLKGMKIRNTVQLKAQKALQQQKTGYNYKKVDKKSPEKPTPVPKERLLVDTVSKFDEVGSIRGSMKGNKGVSASAAAVAGTKSNKKDVETVRKIVEPVYKTTTENESNSDAEVTKHSNSQAAAGPGKTQIKSQESEEEEEEEYEEVRDVYAVRRTDYGEIADFKASELGSRRLKLAQKVCLDAKFLNHTKRLSTRSVLLLPLRTPQAPLVGTEEEHDRLRAIVSQGPDFDKYEKYKQRNTYNDRVGVRAEPKKSVLGAYAEANNAINLMNDRDALYEQLQTPDAVEIGRKLDEIATENVSRAQSSKSTARPSSKSGGSGSLSRKDTSTSAGSLTRGGTVTSSAGLFAAPVHGNNNNLNNPGLSLGYASPRHKVVLNIEKREKIDLVQDCRPRYVDPVLLPSVKELTLVEKMSKEDELKQKLDLRRRQGLGTQHNIAAAREQMEQEVGAPSPFDAPLDASLQVNVADSITGLDTNARNRKLAAEKQVALKKLFLQKEEVHYGEGRITSTHNTKGKIEEPWVTVKGRYTVVQGDRTG